MLSGWQNIVPIISSLIFLIILFRFYNYRLPAFIDQRSTILFQLTTLQNYIRSYELFSSVIFILFYFIAHNLFFPLFILSLAGGVIFGPLLGALLSFIGLFFSSQTYYWAGRYLGPRFIEKFNKQRLPVNHYHQISSKFSSLICFRFNYFIPIQLFNAASGAASINYHRYITSTLTGLSVRIIIYSILGAALLTDSEYFILAVILWAVLVTSQALFGLWHFNRISQKQLASVKSSNHSKETFK